MAGAIEKYKWLPKPGAPWLLGWGGGQAWGEEES